MQNTSQIKPLGILILFVLLFIVASNCHALNVLADPEFKECAAEYSSTKRLSAECDVLWHKIESRMELELEEQRQQEQLRRKENAPLTLRKMTSTEFCVAYGKVHRSEPMDEFSLPKDSAQFVKTDAARRKLKLNTSLITKENIKLGMTECEMLASWGYPYNQNRSVGTYGVHIQHIYGEYGPYVYTENGRVTSWQD